MKGKGMDKRFIGFISAMLILLATAIVPGCNLTEAINGAEQARDSAIVQRDDARAKAANAAYTDREREQYAKVADELDKAIGHANVVIDSLKAGVNPDGSLNIEAAVATAGGLLPPPYGTLIPIFAGFAGLGFKWLQARQALSSTVKGIEAAKAKDPELKAAIKRNADTISEAQTWYAYQTIESLTSGK